MAPDEQMNRKFVSELYRDLFETSGLKLQCLTIGKAGIRIIGSLQFTEKKRRMICYYLKIEFLIDIKFIYSPVRQLSESERAYL